MPEILISTSSFGKHDDSPLRLLQQKGYAVKLNPYGRALTADEVVALAQGVVGIVAGTEPLDKSVLERIGGLKVVSRCGTGMDNVDRESAQSLGIKVFNTPDAPTQAVVELTIGLMIDMLRKTSRMDRALRAGKWEKLMGNLLLGKKVGIIGFGRIGGKVAEMLRNFDCEIGFFDPNVQDGTKDTKKMPIDELLCWADIVTLHLSSKARLIGEREIGLMRKGSWIVNVARGGVIDEIALYNALKSGQIAGAGLDVFAGEPYTGKLRELENVVLTPHIGSYAVEGRNTMEMESVVNLLKGLETS